MGSPPFRLPGRRSARHRYLTRCRTSSARPSTPRVPGPRRVLWPADDDRPELLRRSRAQRDWLGIRGWLTPGHERESRRDADIPGRGPGRGREGRPGRADRRKGDRRCNGEHSPGCSCSPAGRPLPRDRDRPYRGALRGTWRRGCGWRCRRTGGSQEHPHRCPRPGRCTSRDTGQSARRPRSSRQPARGARPAPGSRSGLGGQRDRGRRHHLDSRRRLGRRRDRGWRDRGWRDRGWRDRGWRDRGWRV